MIALFLAVVFFSPAHGEGYHGLSPVACTFSQTIYGPLQFRQVELVSRNHKIGLWRGGDITLNPWIEVSEDAYLGIDKQGQVLQVLRLKDRTVAFLLSGKRKINDIFLQAPGNLLAIDSSGELLQYKHSAWQKSESGAIVAKSIANYGATMCMTGLGLTAYSWIAQSPLFSPEMIASMGLSSLAAFMIEGFRATIKFEKQNEDTDGFQPLNVRLKAYRRSEFRRGDDGKITDYMLTSGTGLISLSEASANVDQFGHNFGLKCEHELLPRGIPPENYEPKF